MILKELLDGVDIIKFTGDEEARVCGISLDSNQVREDYLFAALKGENTDGHNYISSALENGAAALLVERLEQVSSEEISVIQVADTREALALVSANFYKRPTRELTLAGITGTNGKTTITYLLESIWNQERKNSGVIGTIDYRYAGKIRESSMTTPEALDLMRMFREMKDEGVQAVAMEVSSHALDRKRVVGCEFDAAVFTNLTQDHLDYHSSMESYFEVKKELFTNYLAKSTKENKYSIINIDDPYGQRLVCDAPGEVLTYSINDTSASVYAANSIISQDGIKATIHTPNGEVEIHSTLFGEHNLSNILAAVATAVSLGSSAESISMGLSNIDAVPGRLETIPNSYGFSVLVDYAHTPDALKNVLVAARPLTKGNLILVFGCGGDRDNAKRPQMGKIGKELSDILVVTSDNPRTENPEIILDHIEKGVLEAGYESRPYHRIQDRAQAIKKAISLAKEEDTVLIAGKGHEDYQIIGTTKYPFDDREIAKEVLKELGN
ncbi:MAG: UDP-N-acetylmuramoyl-L-alanyl-D-glutamate--2,6-diaminopimelate ligase [Thermodesulfobacteriota bacterium]